MTEIWQLNVVQLAAAIKAKEFTASEALDACLVRISAVNQNINAITRVYEDAARQAAADADAAQARDEVLGPLHGVPFTVKENIDVAGWPVTQGVPALADTIAPADAPIVAQLKNAGAIAFAATNLPDFALRWHTDSSLHGTTLNPWDRDRVAGGSSGGAAAALAVGMGPLALGNDLGGSLRYPAQCCGITSIRPSLGRVARANATMPEELPLSFQLMYVEGPMARSAADLRLALANCSGADSRDPWWAPTPTTEDSGGALPKVALCLDPASMGVDAQVADGVSKAARALEARGYAVEEAEPPAVAEAMWMWRRLLFTDMEAGLLDAVRQVASPAALKSLQLCREFIPTLDQTSLVRTLADRTRLLRDWLGFFQEYPLLLGPVSTSIPFAVDADLVSSAASEAIMDSQRLIVAANLFGLPAVVVPTGVSDRLPQAVQIIGPLYADNRCLDAAEAIEQELRAITPIDPEI